MGTIVDIGAEGITRTASAARGMRQLAEDQTGFRARTTDPSGRTRPAEPAAPIHLGILDHLIQSRQELIDHTRANVPAQEIRPAPRSAAAMYAWYEEHTPHLDASADRVGRAIVYRQDLESRILARDFSVVKKERCPSCRCFCLKWQPTLQRAVCLNERDFTAGNRPQQWSLQQLAEEAVESFSMRAAT